MFTINSGLAARLTASGTLAFTLLFAAAGCSDDGGDGAGLSSSGELAADHCTSDGDTLAALEAVDYTDSLGRSNQTYDAVAHECAVDCLFAEEPSSCAAECIDLHTEHAGSLSCARCHGDFELCTIQNCALPCSDDAGSAACARCQQGDNPAGADCAFDWQLCSGL